MTQKANPENPDIVLDGCQILLLNELTKLANSLNSKKNLFAKLQDKFFISRKTPSGFYLYGDVGRGKTMLMKMFYNQLSDSKKLIHFQHFMQDLHHEIHKLQTQGQNTDKIIEQIARHIAGAIRVLCIDEFEIKDITDAMLVTKLFSCLNRKRIFIFVTTNILPDNLYKDGLQREYFLPFIQMIKKDFTVFELGSTQDYRLLKADTIQRRVFFPANKKTRSEIAKIKKELCNEAELRPESITVFGREMIFARAHQNILFTDFDELFTRDLGYADYVNLCQRFKVIVLENVRIIEENETDIITRVINFIDNAYFYKVLLFALLETEPALLYKAGKRITEFRRTISRLIGS